MSEGLLEPEEKDIRWFSNDESYPPEKREEEKEEEEEESGFSPMRMAALRAAASLLQNSGWRYQPMTTGELIGHAIPAGIKGYYEQDAYNLQQQQLEDQELATIEEDRDKQNQYRSFAKNVDQIPDNVLAVGGDTERASNRRAHLKQMFLDSPEKAMAALNKIYEKLDEVRYREPKTKTLADMRADEKAKVMEKVRAAIPKRIATLMQMEDVPEIEKTKIQTMYGNTDLLTHDRLAKFEEDFTAAMSSKKDRDYTSEVDSLYGMLRNDPKQWGSLNNSQKLRVASVEHMEDKKEARDLLLEVMKESQDQTGWYNFKETQARDDSGNLTTTIIQKKPNFPDEERTITKSKLRGDIIRQSFTGKVLKTDDRFKDFAKIDFEDDAIYDLEKDQYGRWRFSGSVLKMEVDKKKDYANSMIESAYGMGVIDLPLYDQMSNWDPDTAISYLNNQMIKFADEERGRDANEGLIKTGAEINASAKADGTTEWATAGLNYYWDGTTWQEMGTDAADTRFSQAKDLRTEFDKNTKKFKDSIFAYNSIVKGYENSLDDPAAAGVNDIMIVRAFLLMIEPNSVVRESEFASAAKAQGAYNYTINLLDRMKDGAILTKESRARFFRAAMQYMTAVKSGYKLQEDRYKKLADTYGIKHDEVILDPFADRPELQKGVGPYDFQPRQMGKDDFKFLEEVKLMPPKAGSGLQKKQTNNPPLKF